jgi:hypothetical protein
MIENSVIIAPVITILKEIKILKIALFLNLATEIKNRIFQQS